MKRLVLAICVIACVAVPAAARADGGCTSAACGPSYPANAIPGVTAPAPQPTVVSPSPPKARVLKRVKKCKRAAYKRRHPRVCGVRRHKKVVVKVIVKVKVINNNIVQNNVTTTPANSGCSTCACAQCEDNSKSEYPPKDYGH
jgi:hypothetical protein